MIFAHVPARIHTLIAHIVQWHVGSRVVQMRPSAGARLTTSPRSCQRQRIRQPRIKQPLRPRGC